MLISWPNPFTKATPLLDSVSPQYNKDFCFANGPHPENVNVTHLVHPAFVEKWASVLEEYAVRYGDRVKGWWFDSCYDCYGRNHKTLSVVYHAANSGNSYALCAFNNGVKADITKWYAHEELTCGDIERILFCPGSAFQDDAQTHMLVLLDYTITAGRMGRAKRQAQRGFPARLYGKVESGRLSAVVCFERKKLQFRVGFSFHQTKNSQASWRYVQNLERCVNEKDTGNAFPQRQFCASSGGKSPGNEIMFAFHRGNANEQGNHNDLV